MLNRISDFFWRISGWKTFAVGLLLYIFFAVVMMQQGAAMIQQICGKKVEIFDLQFTYTPERAHEILSQYNEAGRSFAATFTMLADSIYPVSYTFLFLMIMGWLFKSLAVYGFRVRYIHLLPFLVMVFDYSENAGIVTMLKNYPDFTDGTVIVTSLFTSLKWSLLAVETFIIGAGLWLLTFYRMSKGRLAR